jgi:hypothetical protein
VNSISTSSATPIPPAFGRRRRRSQSRRRLWRRARRKRRRQGKRFFFEKKKQKTFIHKEAPKALIHCFWHYFARHDGLMPAALSKAGVFN